ncbi:MAG TPA: hypothetical protein PK777_14705, partial [Thermoguttaceae bacterium]|nr:hypothetical protein [Thermoguttaceae bacterium]
CAQIHGEIGDMDKIVAQSKATEDKERTSATAAGAAGTAAEVAGRTGRGPKGGRVLVQTFTPDHPVIQAAIQHDYPRFAQTELSLREAFGYPPFCRMIRLVVRGPHPQPTAEFANLLAERIREQLTGVDPPARVLGPAPAPFAKLRGLYRYHIQLQSPDGEQLRKAVRKASEKVETPENIQWIADVDPVEML